MSIIGAINYIPKQKFRTPFAFALLSVCMPSGSEQLDFWGAEI